MRKQKSNKLRIIHLLLLAALLLLTAKLIYAQVRGGDSVGRIEWTSMQLYKNGSNYDYSYNYTLHLDAKSGQMLYDCSFKAPTNLNDSIWRCELESVPVTREELAPLDALIQGLPLAPPKEPAPVDEDLLVCDETNEIFDVRISNYKDKSVKKLTAPLSGEQRAEMQKQFLQLYLKAKDRAPLRN